MTSGFPERLTGRQEFGTGRDRIVLIPHCNSDDDPVKSKNRMKRERMCAYCT